ncbi:hypothetical protein RIF29_24710 [Crotalaria pallida]|uniref:Uncharacterized protein n=1 Tax=Crotalaria pallida TaxID=3830 RepID=A0AAN9EK77_CROPI
MARKRGRLAKITSPSPSKPPSDVQASPSEIPVTLDFSALDGIDKDLDALSPKQLESVLKKLDVIRSAVKSKAALADDDAILKALGLDKGKEKVSDEPVEPVCVDKGTDKVSSAAEDVAIVTDLTNDKEDDTWTPVISRSKALLRHMELQKGESSKRPPNG